MGAQHSSSTYNGSLPPNGETGAAPDFNSIPSSFSNEHRVGKKSTSLASKVANPRNTIRKSLRKRKERKQRKQNENRGDTMVEGPEPSTPATHREAMDRLRKSFRESFRKKKENGMGDGVKPHLWQQDETTVRAATCAFPVKYLGCVEVYESRGMQVCEEALKVLRASRRRPIKGMLHVSGDGLRVVDDETKGLLVDQTIEKVSFCAPDRNHERGFSYICRDGTTRRWMCHGFVAVKETGERLSHAVGCAFAACLERKTKRDKACDVTMTFDQNNSTFTRMGSFKQMSITERLADPQECKPFDKSEVTSPTSKTALPHAIARPHATPLMLQRQGSCRTFHHLNQSSPFKRQLSLRLSDLPSTLERQQGTTEQNGEAGGDGSSIDMLRGLNFTNDAFNNNADAGSEAIPRSKTTPSIQMSAIPEVPASESDSVSALCQQMSQGLSRLSDTKPLPAHSNFISQLGTRPVSPKVGSAMLVPSVEPIREDVPWIPADTTLMQTSAASTGTSSTGSSKAEEWLAQLNTQNSGAQSPSRRTPSLSQLRSSSLTSPPQATNGAPLRTQQSLQQTDYQNIFKNPNNPFLSTTPTNTALTKAFEVNM